MSYFLSILSGACISLLILIDGWLANAIGVYQASIIFNLAAFLFILLICIITREKFKSYKIPWYMYLGGIANVFTVLFNNLAFGKISVSSILATSLLGQALISAVIDHFGLFNMPKVQFKPTKIIAYIIVLLGILTLLLPIKSDAYFAIFVSLLTGFFVIAARVINAEYSRHESEQLSTLVNYLIGVIGIVIISKVFYNVSAIETIKKAHLVNPLLFLGGAFGVATITINNYVTHKISSYYLTLFLFIGQVFSGILVDIAIDGVFSLRNLVGGMFVLCGLILNIYIDNKNTKLS